MSRDKADVLSDVKEYKNSSDDFFLGGGGGDNCNELEQTQT